MVLYNTLKDIQFETLKTNSMRQYVTVYDEICMWGQRKTGHLNDISQFDLFFFSLKYPRVWILQSGHNPVAIC